MLRLSRRSVNAARSLSSSTVARAHKFEVKPAEFDALLNQSGKTIVVDFKAEWCGPCKMLSPVLESAIPSSSTAVDLVTVDTDEQPELAGRYRVSALPTVIAFKDGKEVGKFVGARPGPAVKQWMTENGISA